jgi:N-dimethylarginine dimethylaminohydrolase
MLVSIKPTTFDLTSDQYGQNEYINKDPSIDRKKFMKQHKELENAFSSIITYTLNDIHESLPDIVFIANGGLSLPRISRTIILPNMKYEQRKRELPYLIGIYNDLGLNMIPFPKEIFEGQAELKWFHGGTLAVGGYGFRSTRKSFTVLDKLLSSIYSEKGLQPPKLLVLKLEDPLYYHLDVAMLEYDDTKCIVHKKAFSPESVASLKKFLGSKNVSVIDVEDSICLNAVVDGDTLVTHKLDKKDKKLLEDLTKRKVHEVNTSEFEKSGGSVRCMTLQIY